MSEQSCQFAQLTHSTVLDKTVTSFSDLCAALRPCVLCALYRTILLWHFKRFCLGWRGAASRFVKMGEEGFTVSLGSYNNRLPRSNSKATAFSPEEGRQSPTFQAFAVWAGAGACPRAAERRQKWVTETGMGLWFRVHVWDPFRRCHLQPVWKHLRSPKEQQQGKQTSNGFSTFRKRVPPPPIYCPA